MDDFCILSVYCWVDSFHIDGIIDFYLNILGTEYCLDGLVLFFIQHDSIDFQHSQVGQAFRVDIGDKTDQICPAEQVIGEWDSYQLFWLIFSKHL